MFCSFFLPNSYKQIITKSFFASLLWSKNDFPYITLLVCVCVLCVCVWPCANTDSNPIVWLLLCTIFHHHLTAAATTTTTTTTPHQQQPLKAATIARWKRTARNLANRKTSLFDRILDFHINWQPHSFCLHRSCSRLLRREEKCSITDYSAITTIDEVFFVVKHFSLPTLFSIFWRLLSHWSRFGTRFKNRAYSRVHAVVDTRQTHTQEVICRQKRLLSKQAEREDKQSLAGQTSLQGQKQFSIQTKRNRDRERGREGEKEKTAKRDKCDCKKDEKANGSWNRKFKIAVEWVRDR